MKMVIISLLWVASMLSVLIPYDHDEAMKEREMEQNAKEKKTKLH